MRHATTAAVSLCALAAPVAAQQAINSESAIQPSEGVVALRQLATFTRFSDDPTGQREDLSNLRLTTSVVYGLSSNLALSARIPVNFRSWDDVGGGSDDDVGLGDPSLALRYRFWQDDTGAVDTRRAVVIAGAELPSGDDEFSSESIDPFIGVAYSQIVGRWSLNADARFKLNTSSERDASRITPGDFADDAFFANGSALYRLSPDAWGPDTTVSSYAVLELNGLFETGGDAEVMLAPGFLWEASGWAWEVSVQIPIAQDVTHRFERDWSVTAGLRLLF
jgi:hypothetical protein